MNQNGFNFLLILQFFFYQYESLKFFFFILFKLEKRKKKGFHIDIKLLSSKRFLTSVVHVYTLHSKLYHSYFIAQYNIPDFTLHWLLSSKQRAKICTLLYSTLHMLRATKTRLPRTWRRMEVVLRKLLVIRKVTVPYKHDD